MNRQACIAELYEELNADPLWAHGIMADVSLPPEILSILRSHVDATLLQNYAFSEGGLLTIP